jgi:hypothetical protein
MIVDFREIDLSGFRQEECEDLDGEMGMQILIEYELQVLIASNGTLRFRAILENGQVTGKQLYCSLS